MEILPLSLTLAILLVFGIANCRGSLLLSQAGSNCSNSTVLLCSFSNIKYVSIQKFNADQNRFNLLTSSIIAQNPDFEESYGDNVYKLKISQVQKYNSTHYLCSGYDEDNELQYSNQWKVVVPSNEVCADLEMNSTVKLDANAISYVNETKQYGAQPGHTSGWTLVLIASVTSVLTIAMSLAAGVTLFIVATLWRIRIKTTLEVPMSVQENGHGSSRDSPVLPARKIDPVSTHMVKRFSAAQPHPVGPVDTVCQTYSNTHTEAGSGMVPEDTSNEFLRSPQVASTDDAAGAVQVAGTVVKYDNVRLQLNPTLLQSTVHQHPAVRCGGTPALLISSRNGHHIDSENVPMSRNPAYVAIEFSQQCRPEAAAVEDVPMQVNPAYESQPCL